MASGRHQAQKWEYFHLNIFVDLVLACFFISVEIGQYNQTITGFSKFFGEKVDFLGEFVLGVSLNQRFFHSQLFRKHLEFELLKILLASSEIYIIVNLGFFQMFQSWAVFHIFSDFVQISSNTEKGLRELIRSFGLFS